MIRYLRLYYCFLTFSLMKSMQFRFDFFFRIFMDSFFYLVNLAAFWLIFQHTDKLAGWSFAQSCFFISVFFVVDALFMVFFSSNLWWFPFLINKGDLDFYLLRPVSTLFFLMLREFSPNSVVNLATAIGILIVAASHLDQSLGLGEWAFVAVAIVNGTLLYVTANLAFVLPIFWTHSGRGMVNLYFSATRLIERPDAIYHKSLRFFLRTLLPFSMIATVPAELVFTGFPITLFSQWLVISLCFYAAVYGAWRIGLRNYSSASS